MKELYYKINDKNYLVRAYLGICDSIKIEVFERNLSKKFFNKKKIGQSTLDYIFYHEDIEDKIKNSFIQILQEHERQEKIRDFLK